MLVKSCLADSFTCNSFESSYIKHSFSLVLSLGRGVLFLSQGITSTEKGFCEVVSPTESPAGVVGEVFFQGLLHNPANACGCGIHHTLDEFVVRRTRIY